MTIAYDHITNFDCEVFCSSSEALQNSWGLIFTLNIALSSAESMLQVFAAGRKLS